jgi:hypothetical protein
MSKNIDATPFSSARPHFLPKWSNCEKEPRNFLGLPRIAECAVGENQCFQAKEEETFANQINQILKSRTFAEPVTNRTDGALPQTPAARRRGGSGEQMYESPNEIKTRNRPLDKTHSSLGEGW